MTGHFTSHGYITLPLLAVFESQGFRIIDSPEDGSFDCLTSAQDCSYHVIELGTGSFEIRSDDRWVADAASLAEAEDIMTDLYHWGTV